MTTTWRTVFTALALAVVLLVAFVLALRSSGELAAKMFADMSWALVLIGATVAGRHSVDSISAARSSLAAALASKEKNP